MCDTKKFLEELTQLSHKYGIVIHGDAIELIDMRNYKYFNESIYTVNNDTYDLTFDREGYIGNYNKRTGKYE